MKYPIIFIFAATLVSCSSPEQTATEKDLPVVLTADRVALDEEQVRLANIETGLLSHQVVSDYVECNGKITLPPQYVMTITSPMGGFVEKVNYLPGDYVKKGALLAVLSHQNYISLQQDYLDTHSQLTYARQEYERQKLLSDGNAAARKKLEQTEAAYRSLMAQQMGLAAQLRYIGINPEKIEEDGIRSTIAIYAPANAYVTEINANPGKFVSEQEQLYELIDKSHLHLDLNVFEKDIAKVEKGQKVYFSLNQNSHRMYEGEVILIGQKLEAITQAFSIHVDPNVPEDFFRPGMFTQARIFMQSDSVAVVPEAAIVQDNNHQYLFVKEGGAFIRKEVETGASVDNMIEIVNPETLKNQEIVVKGAYYLEAELKE